ncbi:MAG TPA: aldehyde dehydrogenase family protein [Pseudolabrys sp.]|nr:aldehyde dehydrogenase family protein [Pseudolabrys sp.]
MVTALKKPATFVLPAVKRDLYYGGAWHKARFGGAQESFCPATGDSYGLVAWAEAEDVDAAVRAAYEGFKVWRRMKPLERALILRKAAEVIRQHGDELALIDAADCGGPFKRMIKDSEASALAFDQFAGLITEIKGDTIPTGDDVLSFTVREPLGVVVRINAYNHPLLFAATHAAPALAAGNAVIMKPPEQAPLSTLRLAELIGPLFPPGVISVLPGGRACGEALVAHPLVAKVGLIGAIPTGKAILKGAADQMKKVSLELGGKNALIGYADADPDKLAAGVIQGMNFVWLGQSCGSTSRAFLHESIHDAVLERVVAKIKTMRFGLPTDPDTEMGCLVNQAQLDKVIHYVEAGKQDGARLVIGGRRPDDAAFAKGFYYEPTIFADVTPSMRIAREEIFGPVLSVFKWRDEETMFEAVNELSYGLTASIWTKNLSVAHRAAARVEAGYVWVNGASTHYYGVPFGGYKQSGLGREESIEELLDNTQLKSINVVLDGAGT